MITDHLSMAVEPRLETSVDQRMISLRGLRFNESCLSQVYLGHIGLSGLHFIQSPIWCDILHFVGWFLGWEIIIIKRGELHQRRSFGTEHIPGRWHTYSPSYMVMFTTASFTDLRRRSWGMWLALIFYCRISVHIIWVLLLSNYIQGVPGGKDNILGGNFFPPLALQPLLGPGLFFSSVIIFYTGGRTPWKSDKPVAWQVGFEPTISAFERAKTVHDLDRTTTVIGSGRS
jgi:hypothetical protein